MFLQRFPYMFTETVGLLKNVDVYAEWVLTPLCKNKLLLSRTIPTTNETIKKPLQGSQPGTQKQLALEKCVAQVFMYFHGKCSVYLTKPMFSAGCNDTHWTILAFLPRTIPKARKTRGNHFSEALTRHPKTSNPWKVGFLICFMYFHRTLLVGNQCFPWKCIAYLIKAGFLLPGSGPKLDWKSPICLLFLTGPTGNDNF